MAYHCMAHAISERLAIVGSVNGVCDAHRRHGKQGQADDPAQQKNKNRGPVRAPDQAPDDDLAGDASEESDHSKPDGMLVGELSDKQVGDSAGRGGPEEHESSGRDDDLLV